MHLSYYRGMAAMIPAQIDLEHHDLHIRVSEPYIYVQGSVSLSKNIAQTVCLVVEIS